MAPIGTYKECVPLHRIRKPRNTQGAGGSVTAAADIKPRAMAREAGWRGLPLTVISPTEGEIGDAPGDR